jgi:hypothetical protein
MYSFYITDISLLIYRSTNPVKYKINLNYMVVPRSKHTPSQL